MVRINEAIRDMLKLDSPKEIASRLEVSEAMVSTWKRKGNDFTPRLGVACKIYFEYGIQIWPYDVRALEDDS